MFLFRNVETASKKNAFNHSLFAYNRFRGFFDAFSLSYFSLGRNVKRITRPRIVSKDEVIRQRNLEIFFDGGKYHDEDFDYIDHRRESRLRKFDKNSKRKTFIDHKALKFHEFPETNHNKLFFDDFVENEEPTYLKYSGKQSKNRFVKTEKRSSDEIAVKSERPILNEDERKLAKIQSRQLVSFPYELTAENRFDVLNKSLIPLLSIPYERQLQYKFRKNADILKLLGSKLVLQESPLKLKSSKMACPLKAVVPSPRIEEYRNKDEFTVWPGIDGNTKTVGFNVGKQSINDQVICVEPDHVVITKKSHIEIAKSFQNYLRTISKLDYCQNYGFAGNWRRLIVRSNEEGHKMVIVNMHPQNLTESEINNEMNQVKEYFKDSVDSLYFQLNKNLRSTHSKTPDILHHLSGSETIIEKLFDYKFIISPTSFFQINTKGGEALYEAVIDQVQPRKNDIILDLCCGVGALSILLSNHCHKVIGVDYSQSSINDAITNAQFNSIDNVQFICNKIEDFLLQINDYIEDNRRIVVILNPSARGARASLLETIRNIKNIEKIVYMSCKPEAEAFKNFSQICYKTNDHEISRFVPINAVPVDLFPHTEHCELVITFERF